MSPLIEWLQGSFDLSSRLYLNLGLTALSILALWLLRRWVLSLTLRNATSVRARYQWSKTTAYLFYIFLILILGQIWLSDLADTATYLGLVSAGLAIALRDPVTNVVGWLFILWRRPFALGDRVQVGDSAGDVVDIRLFQFSLMEIGNWVHADQSTGRIIHVPNGQVFTEKLANYTQGFQYIWNEIPILITFESDWRKAKRILERIIEEHSTSLGDTAEEELQHAARRFLVHFTTLTPIVYTSVEASGVLLTVRYFCPPRQRRDSTQEVWEAVLQAFAQHADIEFAYPTTRFYQTSARARP